MVSDDMKQKIKEYDRKKAVKYQLAKKLESENRKKANNARKHKSRQTNEIPSDLKKFKKNGWQNVPSGHNIPCPQ